MVLELSSFGSVVQFFTTWAQQQSLHLSPILQSCDTVIANEKPSFSLSPNLTFADNSGRSFNESSVSDDNRKLVELDPTSYNCDISALSVNALANRLGWVSRYYRVDTVGRDSIDQ